MADEPQVEEEKEEGVYDVMPGADPMEEAEPLDLNFGLGEEETEAAAEEAEEAEEAEAKAEEDEAEAEEETEEETEAEAEEETEAKTPSKKMVPKSRLDEVLAKQKALQKQLDDLKANEQPAEEAPEAYDFDEREVEYQNLVLDGESAKAAALRQEIRQAERGQLEYELTQRMTQTVAQSQQANALQQAASDLESNFPVFDSASKEYNADFTQEVIDLRDAFIIKGENAVAALSKAARFVIQEHSLVDMDDTTESAPSLSSSKAPPKAARTDEVAKKRAEVTRKLKAADAQPPDMPGEGAATRGEKAQAVEDMTEEEFEALPAATLKRLRGDII